MIGFRFFICLGFDVSAYMFFVHGGWRWMAADDGGQRHWRDKNQSGIDRF